VSGRGPTPEQRAMARETEAREKAEREAQTVTIGQYRIVHIDLYNWQLRGPKLRLDGNYYSSLIHALEALPDKLLDSGTANSLAAVLTHQKANVGLIRDAIREAKTLGLLKSDR